MRHNTRTKINAIALGLYWALFITWTFLKVPRHLHYYFVLPFDVSRFTVDFTMAIAFPFGLIASTHGFFKNRSFWFIHLPLFTLILLPVASSAIYATYSVYKNSANDKLAEREHRCWYFILGETDVWYEGEPPDALPVCRQLADEGSPFAQYVMGTLYQHGGKYVKKDLREAARWYRKAIDQNYPEAFAALASLPASEAGSDNIQEKVSILKKGAELEDHTAMYALSELYAKGDGVPQDFKEAYFWEILGKMRFSYFSSISARELVRHLSPDQRTDAIKKASDAQVDYGIKNASNENFERARWWYQKAAELKNDSAFFNLGLLDETGRGGKQSYSEAAMWYRKAADRGNKNGQWNLGRLYERGLGLTQSYSEAYFWMTLANNAGYPDGAQEVRQVASYLTPEQIDSLTKRIDSWKPEEFQAPLDSFGELEAKAAGGDLYSMNYLGRIYREGIRVDKDHQESLRWYGLMLAKTDPREAVKLENKYKGQIHQEFFDNLKIYRGAAEKGIAETQFRLGEQFLKGINENKNYEEAYFWLLLASKINNPEYLKDRDEAAAHLTSQQIASQKKKASNWLPYVSAEATKQ